MFATLWLFGYIVPLGVVVLLVLLKWYQHRHR